MKNLLVLIFLTTILLFTACQNETSTEASNTVSDTEAPAAKEGEEIIESKETKGVATIYNVDTENSIMKWKGSKAVGGSYHEGTMRLVSGRVATSEEGVVVAGEFVMDVSSLEALNMDDDSKAKLEGHLKSADFFDTEHFMTAEFKFYQIQPVTDGEGVNYSVRGPLRIKDKTNEVTVAANIDVEDGKMTINSPSFTINRTKWGVNFNSGILGTVKDRIINDEVELSFSVVANVRD